MKKIARAMGIAICLVLLLQSAALADTGKIGKEYTLDGECSFKMESAKTYDVFFNQESGAGKQWIVVTVHLLNWRDDLFYVKTEAKAEVIYDGDFEYAVDYLWPDPLGTYYRSTSDEYLRVSAYEDGTIYATASNKSFSTGGGYESPYIKWSNSYFYDPINDKYANNSNDISQHYVGKDPSKTVLDPLVERTYHYVFLVPDLVAEEEGNRELIFTVCDEEYSFRF